MHSISTKYAYAGQCTLLSAVQNTVKDIETLHFTGNKSKLVPISPNHSALFPDNVQLFHKKSSMSINRMVGVEKYATLPECKC